MDIQLQRVRKRLEAKGLFLRMTPEATALVAVSYTHLSLRRERGT